VQLCSRNFVLNGKKIFLTEIFFSFLFWMPLSRVAGKLFWGPTLFPSAYHTASVTGQSPSWMYQAPVYLLSGLTAELVSGVIWTPMDVAKSRLQRGAEDPSTGRSAVRLLRGVWKREGWRGIFRVRGHSWVLWRDNSNPRSTHRGIGCPSRFLGGSDSLLPAVNFKLPRADGWPSPHVSMCNYPHSYAFI